jgi:DNA-binding response OmpR family regulator
VSNFGRLLRQVWGWRHAGDVGRLRTVMKKLRRKPVNDTARPNRIFSGRGVGYRMAGLGVSPPPFR